MRAALTFAITAAVGVVGAIGSHVAAVPPGAAFLLGMTYMIGAALVVNSRSAAV